MKLYNRLVLLFILTAGVNSYTQAEVDSIFYFADESIPSIIILPEKEKGEIMVKAKNKEKAIAAQETVRQMIISDKDISVRLQDMNIDANNSEHISFSQYYKGIKVDNARCVVHYMNGSIDHITNNFKTIQDVQTIPVLSKSEAFKKALSYIDAEKYMWEEEKNEIWIKIEQDDLLATFYPQSELVIFFNEKDIPILSYKFDIYAASPLSRNYVYVNALTGAVEGVINRIQEIQGTAITRYSGTRTIETQYYNNMYRLHDYSGNRTIKTFNMRGRSSYADVDYTNSSTNWILDHINKDNAALDAHWGAMMVYDYFKQKHNSNGFDNYNSPMLNYVNADLPVISKTIKSNDNAFWDGSRVTYGIGTNKGPYTSLDIVAHEFGHGAYESMVRGSSSNHEAGAIAEGLCDIWGVCVEYEYKPHPVNNWTIGEDIVIHPTGKPSRNMSNPYLSDPVQPKTYLGSNWYTVNPYADPNVEWSSVAYIEGPDRATRGQMNHFGVYPFSLDSNYEWTISGGNANILPEPGGGTARITFPSTGNYTVHCRSVSPCSDLRQSVFVTKNVIVGSSLYSSVSPNPANDLLRIEIKKDESSIIAENALSLFNQQERYKIQLYDLFGNLHKSVRKEGNQILLHVSDLPEGNYILHVYESDNEIPQIHRIIIKH